MSVEYSVKTCRDMEEKFIAAKLYRPMRIECYEPGTELFYDITEVEKANKAQVHLYIDKFVGGGFAGQVYRVKVLDIKSKKQENLALKKGNTYAMKIFIPASGFSRIFRNVLYWIGFQGAFQIQVNPDAARAGALWQKFIRRGAKLYFKDEKVVNNIHATFVDTKLGSCGELSEWVDGRTWRLEVDYRMDVLKRFFKGKSVDQKLLGSPEYRAKKKFMADFVKLLHNMGGNEFARQYEWSTCKSQPNCLKHNNTEKDPSAGLVAVDFRAGLTLLPFLPMSPVDFKLILKGIARGSLVQFDLGSVKKLEKYIESNKDEFADMKEMLKELKKTEQVYRNSTLDITHNHIRLFYSRKLWSTIFNSSKIGWRIRNLIDKKAEQKLDKSKAFMTLFLIFGVIPIFGTFLKKIFGRADWRKHYVSMLTSWSYLKRATHGKMIEKVILWHRAGRVDTNCARKVTGSLWRFFIHFPLSIFPPGLHKIFTSWEYIKERLNHIIVRPIKLYFNSEMREQWLRDMISEGEKKHILNDEDAKVIRSQLKEPFIQKYLKSLAVHVCTLPVTQIVSVIVSWIYVVMHPEMSGPEAMAAVAAILILFQITPISPGSLVRGFYVVYLVIRERNFKDYNIAIFLSFFKYIGYLAFPIQMTHRYPALARFMAGHWATEAVHIIPVFGERGALLEHWVFCLFYNWPLTIAQRMQKRSEIRALTKPRYWHVNLYAVGGAIIFGAVDFFYLNYIKIMPELMDIWWVVILISMICGAGVTLGCRGARLSKRIISASVCGIIAGFLYTIESTIIMHGGLIIATDIAAIFLWRMFVFALLSAFGAILTELRLPDPDLK